jgi:hypothetical protein
MVRRNEQVPRNFEKSTVRNILNSLKFKNGNFMEREYIHPQDDEILIYDFMHIRMKA